MNRLKDRLPSLKFLLRRNRRSFVFTDGPINLSRDGHKPFYLLLILGYFLFELVDFPVVSRERKDINLTQSNY
jgi:hypothetical protein